MDASTNEDVKLPVEIKVATPELWPAATAVRKTFTLDTLKGPLAFKLRAISAGELRDLEAQLPIPEAPLVKGSEERRNYDDPAFLERLTGVHFARWIMWLDTCWKPLPGATQAEKVKWGEENLWRNGELTALYNQLRVLSGLGTGEACSPVAAPVVEADPATWAAASQSARLGYKIPHVDAVLLFELAGLSQLKVNQIRDLCRPADPPLRPQIHKMTRKPIHGTDEPDYTDPGYQQALKDAELIENCLLLEAALFTLPGSTKEEKSKWLDARPAYEVRALCAHLSQNVISYRERTDFM